MSTGTRQQGGGPPGPTSSELDARIRRSYYWLASGQAVAAVLAVAVESTRSHLLSPTEVGLVAAALWMVGLVQRLGDLGLGAAIVQRADLSDAQLTAVRDAVRWVALAATVVAALASPALASWFENERVGVVLLGLLPMVLFSGLQVPEQALLTRAVQFGPIVRAEIRGTAARLVVLVALALSGAGVWSLVIAYDVGAFVTWIVLRHSCAFVPARPADRSEVRSAMKFGAHVSLSTLLHFIYTNADYLLLGRFWPERMVGLYFGAFRLSSLPAERLGTVVQRVSFPVFVQARASQDSLRERYVGTVGQVSFVTLPAALGLAAIAPEAVMALYGPQWMEIVPIVRLLCIAAALRSISAIGPRLLLALGRPLENVWIAAAFLVVLVPVVAVTAPQGLLPLAVAWTVASGVLYVLLTLYGSHRAGAEWRALAGPIGRPLLASLAMTAVLLLATNALPAFDALGTIGAAWLRTALLAALGSLVYALVLGLMRVRASGHGSLA